MSESYIEPWLRGPVPGVHPVIGALIHSLQHAKDDLARWTEGLTDDQIWARPNGLTPVGSQIRHIAGSVERLMTYALGAQLDEQQLAELKREMEPGATRTELFAHLEASFTKAEANARGIGAGALEARREVGRKRLPTTVAGVLIHIAEHTQRHTGQAIVTAKLVKV